MVNNKSGFILLLILSTLYGVPCLRAMQLREDIPPLKFPPTQPSPGSDKEDEQSPTYVPLKISRSPTNEGLGSFLLLPEDDPSQIDDIPSYISPLRNFGEDVTDGKADYELAVKYYNKKDYENALTYFTSAERKGLKNARGAKAHVHNRMGYLLVKKGSFSQAKDLFILASQNGNSSALYNLGMLYFTTDIALEVPAEGLGVALEYFKESLELAENVNQRGLDNYVGSGKTTDTHYDSVLKSFQKSKQNTQKAINEVHFVMGFRFYKAKDFPEAKIWLDMAAVHGHKKAQQYIKKLKEKVIEN